MEQVMVFGASPSSPPLLLGDGHRASLQMATPRATIGMNLAMGSGTCVNDHACTPHKNSLSKECALHPHAHFSVDCG